MTAHKNRGNTIAMRWRNEAIFLSLLLMLSSLYISRAALSVTSILFLCLAIIHKDFSQQVKKFYTTPFLFLLSFLFFIPFISGLWSSNAEKWSDVMRIKLPLLFFPIAFAGNWKLSARQWMMVAIFFLLIVFSGCIWSLIDYVGNIRTIYNDYLRAKTIATPLENDHVRFSWLVSVAIIICFLLFQLSQKKWIRIAIITLATFFIIYLHILSARTGVLSLYLFLIIYALWLLFKSNNVKGSIIFLLVLMALPAAAYFILPTFKARLHYVLYDLSFVRKEQYLPYSSDGARTMSLQAGWDVLKQHPFGVGAGDVMKQTGKWYVANVPQVLPNDKFYPSSEWLMYACFAGWTGLMLFSIIMFYPFLMRIKRHKIYWIAFNATAAFSFVFDMGLEVQYGVFLYAFIAFCLWKGLHAE